MADNVELDEFKKLHDAASDYKHTAWIALIEARHTFTAIELEIKVQIALLNTEHEELSDELRAVSRRYSGTFRRHNHHMAKSRMAKVAELRHYLARVIKEKEQLGKKHKRALSRYLLRQDVFFAANDAYFHAWAQYEARRAGVPSQYFDNLRVTMHSNGSTGIYFGGIGGATGPEHGHYVLDETGELYYTRLPFGAHGAHNFVRHPQHQMQTASMTPRLA